MVRWKYTCLVKSQREISVEPVRSSLNPSVMLDMFRKATPTLTTDSGLSGTNWSLESVCESEFYCSPKHYCSLILETVLSRLLSVGQSSTAWRTVGTKPLRIAGSCAEVKRCDCEAACYYGTPLPLLTGVLLYGQHT